MRFSEWQRQLSLYNMTVDKAQEELERVSDARDKFLKDTVGFAPRMIATVEGTAELVSKVLEMKKEES